MEKKYIWIILSIIAILIFLFIYDFILFRESPPLYSGDWKTGVCPSVKGIDCMPIIDSESPESVYCKPENRQWIEENCPDIKFFD